MGRSRGLLLALAVLVALLAACGGNGDDVAAAPRVECRDVEQPEARAEGREKAPTELLVASKTYRVVVATSCGEFTITLDPEASPKATASFVELANNGFFDKTFFHRIVPGFVIQGGDPTGTGTGGPGYTTVDTPARGTTYGRGVVAMAKGGDEPRGAAGSQFFVVTGTGVNLPPDYAVIGRVTSGMNVVQRIGLLGDPSTELPTQPVVVESMTVEVS